MVAWLSWAPEAAPNRSGADAVAGYLPQARAAGAQVIELVGPLDELTGHLSRTWALPAGPLAAGAEPQSWRPEIEATASQRAQATAALYGRMGFRQRTVEVLIAKHQLTPDEQELLADALWGTGGYRAAGRHWQQARSGDAPDALARRTERAVAVRRPCPHPTSGPPGPTSGPPAPACAASSSPSSSSLPAHPRAFRLSLQLDQSDGVRPTCAAVRRSCRSSMRDCRRSTA